MRRKLKKIVLVDDDGPTNFLNKLIITKRGVAEEVITYQNVLHALQFLKDNQPELIFLDINMPALSGWDFLDRYRELNPASKNTRIIMLTTSADPRDRQKALQYEEVSDLVNKPLTFDSLDSIFEEHFVEA